MGKLIIPGVVAQTDGGGGGGKSASWGNIDGTLSNQTDLQEALNDVNNKSEQNADSIEKIERVIPSQASSSNLLADRKYVNSSIAANTANFIGTFESVADLNDYSGNVTNNDYAFIVNRVVDNNGSKFWNNFDDLNAYNKALLTNNDYAYIYNNYDYDLYKFNIISQEWEVYIQDVQLDDRYIQKVYNRYKASSQNNTTTWIYEYSLTDLNLTYEQWEALNSGVTSNDVALARTALQPNDLGNATIVITQGGVEKGSFTTNQKGNATIELGDELAPATDTTFGIIKLNSSQLIDVNSDGQLTVGGRLSQLEGTNGLFTPADREPRYVDNYSLLITDAKGIEMRANRALAIVSGLTQNLNSSHAAGSTEYQITNNYENRIIAKCCENGFISLDETSSTKKLIEPVLSVTINGAPFAPDSSAGSSTPIVIKVANSVNPDAATSRIRLFGSMYSYASAHLGSGVSTTGSGGRSLVLGAGVTKAGGNDACMVGMNMYNSGHGNALFGRNHIARKNRGFFAGSGHDGSNAKSEAAAAFGEYSYIDGNTAFAVGNGSSATSRSNAFEVTTDSGIVLKSPNGTRFKIRVADDGTLITTAL